MAATYLPEIVQTPVLPLPLHVLVHVFRVQGSLRHMQFIAAGKPRPAGIRWGKNHRAVSI